jgi:hypothetical protein
MTRYRKLISYLSGSAATALLSAASLVPSSPAAAACNGPAGTGSDTSTVCVTAVAIPGQPLRSFDISWVNTTRSEYYLADRSNAGIIVVSTRSPFAFLRTIPGFVGIKPTSSGGAKLQIRLNGCSLSSTAGFLSEVASQCAIDLPLPLHQRGESRGVTLGAPFSRLITRRRRYVTGTARRLPSCQNLFL